MTIDISKIRVGDTVTIPSLKVSSELRPTFDGFVITVSLPCGDEIDLTSEDIASHTPQPRELKVGDRVFVDKERTPRVIGAVFMDVALLDVAGSPMAFNTRRLTLVDPNQ